MFVKDFEELAIYQKSRALAKQVYQITKSGDLTLSSAIATRHSPKTFIMILHLFVSILALRFVYVIEKS